MSEPDLKNVIAGVSVLLDVVTEALNESGRGVLAARTAETLHAVIGVLRQVEAQPVEEESEVTIPTAQAALQASLGGTVPVQLPRAVVAQIVRDYAWLLPEKPSA